MQSQNATCDNINSRNTILQIKIKQPFKSRTKSQQDSSEDKVICVSAGVEGGAPGFRYSSHSLGTFVAAASGRELVTQSMEHGLAPGQQN